jgi:hypothetical protein
MVVEPAREAGASEREVSVSGAPRSPMCQVRVTVVVVTVVVGVCPVSVLAVVLIVCKCAVERWSAASESVTNN